MADETHQAATPPALVGDEDESSRGEGATDLWAATAIANVEEEEEEEPPATTTTSEDITVTHAEGERHLQCPKPTHPKLPTHLPMNF